MRTTIDIEGKLIENTSEITGINEKTSLVKFGLESLIARESSKRPAKLGGSEKNIKSVPRRIKGCDNIIKYQWRRSYGIYKTC